MQSMLWLLTLLLVVVVKADTATKSVDVVSADNGSGAHQALTDDSFARFPPDTWCCTILITHHYTKSTRKLCHGERVHWLFSCFHQRKVCIVFYYNLRCDTKLPRVPLPSDKNTKSIIEITAKSAKTRGLITQFALITAETAVKTVEQFNIKKYPSLIHMVRCCI